MTSKLSARGRQHGAVLVFALIALIVLLVGAVAMVRSLNVTLFTAGNYGFKRDLVQQSERASAAVFDSFRSGLLKDIAVRNGNLPTANYSSTILPANAQGIPNALLTPAAFALVGVVGNDIQVPDQGVLIRYVVDRLCVAGHLAKPDTANCTMAGVPEGSTHGNATISATQGTHLGAGATIQQAVYRISIRVTGPRNTQTFFQSTLAI